MANNEALLMDDLSPEEVDNLQKINIIRAIHEDIAEIDKQKTPLQEASQVFFASLFEGQDVYDSDIWDNRVNLGKLYFLIESLLKRGNETNKVYELTELGERMRLLFGRFKTDKLIEHVMGRLLEEQFIGYADGFKVILLGVTEKNTRVKYRYSWTDYLG